MNEVRANVQSWVQSIEDRAPIREAKKSLLAQWKEQVTAMRAASPRGKLGEQVNTMYGEVNSFLGWVEELGGERCAEFFICAKVSRKATLEQVSGEFMLNPAMMWAFITETDDRYQHYIRAQNGVADALINQVASIVDGDARVLRNEAGEVELGPDGKPIILESDLARDKLRAETYIKLGERLDRKRFGGEKVLANSGSVGMVIDAGLAFAASELLARIARPASQPQTLVISDADFQDFTPPKTVDVTEKRDWL